MVTFPGIEKGVSLFSIDFSLTTLSITLIVPFLYYSYQTRLWDKPHLRKRGDILLMFCVCTMIFLLLLKMAQMRTIDWAALHLPLLHLIGPILTILAIRKTRFDRWLNKRFFGAPAGEQKTASKAPPTDTKAQFVPLVMSNKSDQVSWSDIIINHSLKEQLLSTIELLQSPQQAHKYGIDVPKGMIFHGPPGTGKTTIARAFAGTAGLNFFAVKADDIISKWVGESEKNLTQLFQAAEKHRPAVVFIDEIDTIGRTRGDKSQAWAENLLNHFLQLLDGIVKMEGVYVIGATNRIDLVDDALKRSGRLSKSIEIAAPDLTARTELFRTFLRRLHLDDCIELPYLAQMTEGCTGADIKEICNQAGLNAFNRESKRGNSRQYLVTEHDLFYAIEQHMQQLDTTHQSY